MGLERTTAGTQPSARCEPYSVIASRSARVPKRSAHFHERLVSALHGLPRRPAGSRLSVFGEDRRRCPSLASHVKAVHLCGTRSQGVVVWRLRPVSATSTRAQTAPARSRTVTARRRARARSNEVRARLRAAECPYSSRVSGKAPAVAKSPMTAAKWAAIPTSAVVFCCEWGPSLEIPTAEPRVAGFIRQPPSDSAVSGCAQAVRQDGSFAKKQASPPAHLVVVPSGRLFAGYLRRPLVVEAVA
jgi:hypothetical protein